MRTHEFTCARCGQTVKETTQGYDACPDYCQSCLLVIQARTAPKLGDVKKPETPAAPTPPSSAPIKKTPPAPPPPKRKSNFTVSVRLLPTCPSCKGRGKIKGSLCPACDGSGVKGD